jgi:L-ribulose-5-phosphate 4-epimerase
VVEAVADHGAAEIPCALVRGHAPFCWGRDPAAALENAVTLEEVARMALLTTMLEPGVAPLDRAVREKHFQRKHGPRAYYGQSS